MFVFILQVAKEFSRELSVLSFLSQCETCEKLPTIKKTAIGDYLRLLCCRIGEEQSLRLFKINLLSVAILSSSCNTSAAQLIWDIFSSQSLSSACTLVLCAKGRRLRPSEAAAVLLSSSSSSCIAAECLWPSNTEHKVWGRLSCVRAQHKLASAVLSAFRKHTHDGAHLLFTSLTTNSPDFLNVFHAFAMNF